MHAFQCLNGLIHDYQRSLGCIPLLLFGTARRALHLLGLLDMYQGEWKERGRRFAREQTTTGWNDAISTR